jgi:hypothetical protein
MAGKQWLHMHGRQAGKFITQLSTYAQPVILTAQGAGDDHGVVTMRSPSATTAGDDDVAVVTMRSPSATSHKVVMDDDGVVA